MAFLPAPRSSKLSISEKKSRLLHLFCAEPDRYLESLEMSIFALGAWQWSGTVDVHVAVGRGHSWGLSRFHVLIDATPQLSDGELVTRAQSGDPQALNSLICSLRPRILGYCRSRLSSYPGGWDAADDAAQEACAAVVHALPSYRPQGAPFLAFVYSIAARKVADTQRRFSRSAICVEDLPEQTEPSPTPEEHAITSAGFQAVQLLLDQLPDRMREVLVLRAAGASAEQVGEKLGMSANAVRVAQHRAIAKLRRLVDSDEYDELWGSAASHSRRAA